MESKHLLFHKRLLCRYFIPILILFCLFGQQAYSGSPGPIKLTDGGADRVVYYFDTRNRSSHIQLANLSNLPVRVRVQIFTVNTTIVSCEEIDFFDDYSGFDVHTYDMSALVANDAPGLGASLEPNAYGFVVISRSTGTTDALSGTMRIIDNSGHEFRANAAAPESGSTDGSAEGIINFSNANGHSSSEVIGFTYTVLDSDTVYASSGVQSLFGDVIPPDQISIQDEFENDFSCSPRLFSCSDENSNIAIDNSLPNTKGEPNRVCNTSIIDVANDSGYLRMPFESYICTDPFVALPGPGNLCPADTYFVGFVGLTNGTGSGTFDSWWEGGTTP